LKNLLFKAGFFSSVKSPRPSGCGLFALWRV